MEKRSFIVRQCYTTIVKSFLYFGAVCLSGNINSQDRIRLDTFINDKESKWDCKDGTGHGSWIMGRVLNISGR